MSQMDVDDVSLPTQDAESSSTPKVQNHQRPPYGTLRFPGGDELVSVGEIAEELRQARGRYHRLDLQHAELGDARFQRILELLRSSRESEERSEENNAAISGYEKADQDQWLILLRSTLSAWQIRPRPPYYAFRIIELDSNQLTSKCLPAIAAFLTDNLAIHQLTLRANQLDDDVAAFSNLARAIGRSTLRRLALSSNPISFRSIAAFLDSIPPDGTALEHLDLANTMRMTENSQHEDTRQSDVILAANSIANFIADSRRCRSLCSLSLNGNDLGDRGVRTVISALTGGAQVDSSIIPQDHRDNLMVAQNDPFFRAVAQARMLPPNRSLERLEIIGNLSQPWRRPDPQEQRERIGAIKKRYASSSIDELEVVVSFIDSRALRNGADGSFRFDDEVPVEVTRHLSSLGVTLDECESDLEDAWEIVGGLNSLTYDMALKSHDDTTRIEGERARQAAVTILKAARILGCRATGQAGQSGAASATPGFHKYLDLPPELRLHVLRQLDESGSLCAHQFENVISFACEPSTIGYGERDFDWTRILNSGTTAKSLPSTLPAHAWCWNDCFALRAPPQDWEADLLDASDDPKMSRPRSIRANTQRDHASLPSPNPGLFAFFESTLTHRAELSRSQPSASA